MTCIYLLTIFYHIIDTLECNFVNKNNKECSRSSMQGGPNRLSDFKRNLRGIKLDSSRKFIFV